MCPLCLRVADGTVGGHLVKSLVLLAPVGGVDGPVGGHLVNSLVLHSPVGGADGPVGGHRFRLGREQEQRPLILHLAEGIYTDFTRSKCGECE